MKDWEPEIGMWVVLDRGWPSMGGLANVYFGSGGWDEDIYRIFRVEEVVRASVGVGLQLRLSTYGDTLPETYHSSWLEPYTGFSTEPTPEELEMARLLGYNV